VAEILVELHARGIQIEPRPHGGVKLVPARLIDPELFNRIHAHKAELLALLARQSADTVDRVEIPTDATPESLIDICRFYGVCLRIDPDRTVIVESYGKAWCALVGAIAAHVDEIASILLTTGRRARLVPAGRAEHGQRADIGFNVEHLP
jgi:hypothetical protein